MTDQDRGTTQVKGGRATIISSEPLILLTSISREKPLGIGSTFTRDVGPYPAVFLITVSWSIQSPARARELHEAAEAARAKCAHQEFIFLGNTEIECSLLEAAGEHAVLVNHNIFVSEQSFRPLAGVEIEFDAIYNARFAAWKRHELAQAIPKVAYVAYHFRSPLEDTDDAVRTRISVATALPGHTLLNSLVDGLPVRLNSGDVNVACNRAAVGLCLSPAEGAMLASVEYMLAGLPVVSTPSTGGRDQLFDPDYCSIVEPDKRVVAEAVAALRARRISRDHIRSRTLTKVEPHRRRLLSLLEDLLAQRGHRPRFGSTWSFHDRNLLAWNTLGEISGELRRIIKTGAG